MKSSYDYLVKTLFGRVERRTNFTFGFPIYGVWRYIKIGKIGIRLWEAL